MPIKNVIKTDLLKYLVPKTKNFEYFQNFSIFFENGPDAPYMAIYGHIWWLFEKFRKFEVCVNFEKSQISAIYGPETGLISINY